MKASSLFALVCALLVVGFPFLRLLAAPSAIYVPVLPGDDIKVEKLASRADVIVATGVLVDLGRPSHLAGPGQYSYFDAKFKITKFLKGKCGNTVKLLVQIFYSSQEENPTNGTEYIVFIYTSPEENVMRAVKLLPADQQSIDKVTAAISAVHK